MNEKKIIIISVIAFIALLVVSFYIPEKTLSTNILLIALGVLLIPYNLYKFFRFKKIKIYEKEFPNFLRDIAESKRAGLSLLEALRTAASYNYGSFTEEVKKMKNQLSWNIPLEDVLRNFSKRVKDSKLITRSIEIIIEANKSGGNVEDTMESLASNMEMIKDVNEEKSTLLGQQIFMMYAIFFIFLGISIVLIKFLVPLLQSQMQENIPTTGLEVIKFAGNPCKICLEKNEIGCIGCNIFFKISDSFGFGDAEKADSYYKSLFFVMVIVQGLFSGLIAGQIGSDSVIAGVKHSLVMVVSGIIIFLMTIYIGFI